MSEAAEWPRARDKVYEHYSDQFRRQCNKLARLARQENHEGAHFVFLHMTTTCIDCHNYVRGAFRVARDSSDPSGPVQLIPTEWEGDAIKRRDPKKIKPLQPLERLGE